MSILKRMLLLVAACALAFTASLATAQTVSCEDTKSACTIARKATEQAARDTNEGCQDNCAIVGGSNLSACRAACLATKAAVVGTPGVLGSAATTYASCVATACTGQSCQEQAEDTRHDCDEAARDTASSSIRNDPTNAPNYLSAKNVQLAACGAAEATTRATVCASPVDCVKSCGETEHQCSEASRDVEKTCRVACATSSDATCKATCEAARDTAVGTCLTSESSCVTACVAPPVVCPCAAGIAASTPASDLRWADGGVHKDAVPGQCDIFNRSATPLSTNAAVGVSTGALPVTGGDACFYSPPATGSNIIVPVTTVAQWNACVALINSYGSTLAARTDVVSPDGTLAAQCSTVTTLP